MDDLEALKMIFLLHVSLQPRDTRLLEEIAALRHAAKNKMKTIFIDDLCNFVESYATNARTVGGSYVAHFTRNKAVRVDVNAISQRIRDIINYTVRQMEEKIIGQIDAQV